LLVTPAERTGVLVLRVWIESDADNGLRARITHERDLGSGERVSVVSGAVDEIVEIIWYWLQDFLAEKRESGAP
jgi:hypothetical protein